MHDRRRIVGRSHGLKYFFKEIVADLDTLEVMYDEKDLTLILLCSLTVMFTLFRDTIL